MPARRPLPGPVAAGLGLVARGVDVARQVPEELPALPVRALAFALRAAAAAKSTYEELADRGEQAVATLRHNRPQDLVDDAEQLLREAEETVGDAQAAVRETVRNARDQLVDVTDGAVDRLRGAGDNGGRGAFENRGGGASDGGEATPPGSTVGGFVPEFELSDELADRVAEATPGATLAHDELPLADYDHMTLGSLRARLPRLDPVALVQLRDYERTHANRLPVVTMLENRLAKVAAADGGTTAR